MVAASAPTSATLVASEVKEEVKESCEMENSEVRFYDVRSSKGRLPILNKVSCCDLCFSVLCYSLFVCSDPARRS